MKMKTSLLVFCSVLLIESIALGGKDFPNYFQELVSTDGNTTPAEAKIEAAMTSIIRRLQVPHVEGKNSDGTPNIVTDGFFRKLEEKVHEKDPGAKVYVAGGVVRSLLGYIYKKVYNAKQKDPSIKTEAILDRIIAGKDKKNPDKDKEILSLKALGVGSDLDILIEPSADKKDMERSINHELTDFINSAEKALGLRDVSSKLKYAVVPVGDVKNYEQQMSRATSQGGSALDWLAFPLTKTGGAMKEPKADSHIFKDFISGHYDYLAATDSSKLEDPDKQTVRGLRALLEIPFLQMSLEGKKQMTKELDVLIKKVQTGSGLSPRALEQFEKMIRNARFEGAHNRFYSFDPTPSASEDLEIEHLVHQVSQALPKGDKTLPLIPEFIMNQDPKKREDLDRCDLAKNGLLMSQAEFVKDHTDNGIIYHGTPKLDNILCIIRNGFVRSSAKQGLAACGPGAYATKHSTLATGFGTPIAFTLKEGVSPRILDWNLIKDNPNLKAVISSSDPEVAFKKLVKDCDVDIIVNDHVLIQNSGSISLPKNIKDIIKIYANSIAELTPEYLVKNVTKEQIRSIFERFTNYESFLHLGEMMGMKDLPPSMPLAPVALSLLKNTDPGFRTTTVSELGKIGAKVTNPDIHQALANALGDVDAAVRSTAAVALGNIGPAITNSDVHQALANALGNKKEDAQFRKNAAMALGKIGAKVTNPDIHQALANALRDVDAAVRSSAAGALGNIGPAITNSDIHQALANALRDAESAVQSSAAVALGRISPAITSSEIHQALADVMSDKRRDVIVRRSAGDALSMFGSSVINPKIHLAIANALGDADLGLRVCASHALGEIGPAVTNPGIHQALAHALGDSEKLAQHYAVGALENIGPSITNPAVHEKIIQRLRDRNFDPKLKNRIAELLHKIIHTTETKTHLLEALTANGHAPDCEVCKKVALMDSTMRIEEFAKLMEEVSEKLQ